MHMTQMKQQTELKQPGNITYLLVYVSFIKIIEKMQTS